MTAAPEYLYGDFKIRRRCAWVEDPEALRVEVEVRGANHPLFWVRTERGAGWHLSLSAYVDGLRDAVQRYRVISPDSAMMRVTTNGEQELERVEWITHAELRRDIAHLLKLAAEQ